eukprot:1916804-Pyramimonas_sp.AAC.1
MGCPMRVLARHRRGSAPSGPSEGRGSPGGQGDRGHEQGAGEAGGSGNALQLTAGGLRQVLSHACWGVKDSTLVAALGERDPLENRTDFSLMIELLAEGWVWELYTPPSKRRKEQRKILDGYSNGDAKIMRTSLTNIPRGYFLCLMQADTLFEAGLQIIPHGQSLQVYGKILKHDFSVVQSLARALEDGAAELDVDVAGPRAKAAGKAGAKGKPKGKAKAKAAAAIGDGDALSSDQEMEAIEDELFGPDIPDIPGGLGELSSDDGRGGGGASSDSSLSGLMEIRGA